MDTAKEMLIQTKNHIVDYEDPHTHYVGVVSTEVKGGKWKVTPSGVEFEHDSILEFRPWHEIIGIAQKGL